MTALPTDRRALVKLLADTRTQLIVTQQAYGAAVNSLRVCDRPHSIDRGDVPAAAVIANAERILASLPPDPDAQAHVDHLIEGLR